VPEVSGRGGSSEPRTGLLVGARHWSIAGHVDYNIEDFVSVTGAGYTTSTSPVYEPGEFGTYVNGPLTKVTCP
jgi:hypothetical protein